MLLGSLATVLFLTFPKQVAMVWIKLAYTHRFPKMIAAHVVGQLGNCIFFNPSLTGSNGVDKFGLHTPVPQNDCSTWCWGSLATVLFNPSLTGNNGVDKIGLPGYCK
jgi:hypothetical protein